jgi:hypothetical protein
MEPLRDDELDVLLREGEPRWRPSPGLDGRLMSGYRPRPWEWLWRGSVRVPVPVILGLLVAFLWWQRARGTAPAEIDMNQFRPVEQLEIKVVRSGDAQR